MAPTLSVILPNYNHAQYLPDAIREIAEQSRPPDEFLILDDASTDDSVSIIEDHIQRYPFIRLLRHEKNQGVIAAHDTLFREATGDYLLPAAADDKRLPEFFSTCMKMAERFPQAGLIFGKMAVINEADEEIDVFEASRWSEELYASPERFLEDFLNVELASHALSCSTIYRRDAFMEVGCYRPELGTWTDTFAFRAIALKHGVCYIPHRLSAWRKLTGSYSHSSRLQPKKLLDYLARAAHLMRSAEYRDRFPPNYVKGWQREYRRLIVWNYLLGEDPPGPRPSFLSRNFRRLPRLAGALALAFYKGDVSCYTELVTE